MSELIWMLLFNPFAIIAWSFACLITSIAIVIAIEIFAELTGEPK